MGCSYSAPRDVSTKQFNSKHPREETIPAAAPTTNSNEVNSSNDDTKTSLDATRPPALKGFRAPPSQTQVKTGYRLFRNRLQPVREDSQEPMRVGSLLPGAQRRTAPPERVELESKEEEEINGPRSRRFLGKYLKLDPSKVLCYLDENDRAALACCSKASLLAVQVFEAVYFAKLETKPLLNVWEWSKLNTSTKGDGVQWNKLKRRLLRAPTQDCVCTTELMENLTPESFEEKYEKPRVPVIIRGGTDRWPMKKEWTSLQAVAPVYGECSFRFNDLHGEEILFKHYVEYALTTEDDSPLGLYDSQFGAHDSNDPRTTGILHSYEPPECFGIDLFARLPEDSRPPYRWILIGLQRSGTEMHVDPLGTSAWVGLLSGRKRWVMFPPETDFKIIGGANTSEKKWEDKLPSALEWFTQWWGNPSLKANTSGCVEILQHPGEIVFVPGGWAHIVINIENTVAMTHNYAPLSSWSRVRESLMKVEPEMYESLIKVSPSLAE